jgi:hypothetical protein
MGAFGVISAGVMRFVIVPGYCTQRADGTYGELYGPVHFAAPYVYSVSAVLVFVGVPLVVSALKISRNVSSTLA